jgi:enoyl-CoA hydratase/carnithine racemase
MNEEPYVLVDHRDDGVAVVTLNRPERLNAVTGAGLALLAETYRSLDADDDVRAVVLTGAGRAFCTGADLRREAGAFAAPSDMATFRSSPPRPLAFQIRKPVIAAINGHAVGLGFTLALHCDVRIIAEEARWGVVQVRRGMVGDAVSHWTLVRTIGVAKAAELLLAGRMHTGPEAVRLGIASTCLPAAQVLTAATSLATEMAESCSPLSMAFSKRILWAAADGDVAAVDELETEAHRLLMGSADAMEGGLAGAERRSPAWTSRVARDWPASGPFADGVAGGPPEGFLAP